MYVPSSCELCRYMYVPVQQSSGLIQLLGVFLCSVHMTGQSAVTQTVGEVSDFIIQLVVKRIQIILHLFQVLQDRNHSRTSELNKGSSEGLEVILLVSPVLPPTPCWCCLRAGWLRPADVLLLPGRPAPPASLRWRLCASSATDQTQPQLGSATGVVVLSVQVFVLSD